MTETRHQRCFNHSVREAAARCPACSRFFCRECVTEHNGRVLCAACLRQATAAPRAGRAGFAGAVRVAQVAGGILAAWFFFFMIGQTLTLLPETFHDANLWKVPWNRTK